MVADDRVLRKLDYDKILVQLAERCALPYAREMAEALRPFLTLEEVRAALDETTEARTILRINPLFSIGSAKEIRSYLERTLRGGVLVPEELLHLRDTLRSARQTKHYVLDSKLELPLLRDLVQGIEVQKSLEDEISRCITEDGEVADKASVELGELRRAKSRTQQKIRDTLDGILRAPSNQKILQESLVTQRSDRYVIPVKQEYRSSFPGIVHDQSASGATLFIEPMAVVQLGNELREITLREMREIQRILLELSAKIEALAEDIQLLYEILARIDLILAKAHLSEVMEAGPPKLSLNQEIRLVRARHPLLKGYVVPLTIELGVKFDTVVVTGPNTGGKTVALKTVGLLLLMAQSGLHIPAESDSAIGIFTRVFADIGDEQSVEQSLSTFSGHMKNIVEIVNEADNRSLVLLDELGAGTDPTEGAALAMAILSDLHERGCRIISTTHYGALKSFAYKIPRVINASVEFDVETLRPTYRLLLGIPGKSNAFYIAGRLGLTENVLDRAKDFVSEREMQVADLIENLEDKQREIDYEMRKAEEARKAVEVEKESIEKKSLALEEDYQEFMAKAKDEATELIRKTRLEAEKIITELKEEIKKERKQQQAIEKARLEIKNLSGRFKGQEERSVNQASVKELKLGQTVYLTKLRQKGQVIKLPNEDSEVQVQAGIIKVMVPLSELRIVKEEKVTAPRGSGEGRIGKAKTETVRSEIDLRGMLVDEATIALDKYLDDAALSGLNQIYVIHGKGTGALRAGVQDFLRSNPHVKSFRLGQHGEGDLGVTVVELK